VLQSSCRVKRENPNQYHVFVSIDLLDAKHSGRRSQAATGGPAPSPPSVGVFETASFGPEAQCTIQKK
jgi:hypothetical protein